jgi:hypothetical protein
MFRVKRWLVSMGFAGYAAVCMQLYCRCFTVLHLVVTVYTTCFGLHGHLQVYRVSFSFYILEGICFAGFACTWLHFARFICVFLFCSLRYFSVSCVCVCLLVYLPFLVVCLHTYTPEDGHVGRNM